MADYISSFSKDDFIGEMSVNGWKDAAQLDFFGKLFEHAEKFYEEGLDDRDVLDGVMGHLSAVSVNNIDEVTKLIDGIIYNEQYKMPKELVASYEKLFPQKKKERSEEIERQKLENYNKNIKANNKAFKDYFQITRTKFRDICAEKGWLYQNSTRLADDRKALGKIYDVAANSGDKRLIGLLDKLLVREVNTKEGRDAAVKEIYDTLNEVLKDDNIRGGDRLILNNIIKNQAIRPDLTKGDIDIFWGRYIANEQKNNMIDNKRIFRQKMYDMGWDKYNYAVTNLLNTIFDVQWSNVKNGVSPIDGAVEKFMNTSLKGRYSATKRIQIVETLLDDVNKSDLPSFDKQKIADKVNEVANKKMRESAAKEKLQSKIDSTLPKFQEKLSKRGWSPKDISELEKLHEKLVSANEKGDPSLNKYMSIILDAKLNPKSPCHSKNEVLREFVKQIEKSGVPERYSCSSVAKEVISFNLTDEQAEIKAANKADKLLLQANKAAGKKLFVEKLIANGWAEAEKAYLEDIFEQAFDINKGFDEREAAFGILTDAQVNQNNPKISKANIINDFIKAIESCKERTKDAPGKDTCDKLIEASKNELTKYEKAIYQQKFEEVSNHFDKNIKTSDRAKDYADSAAVERALDSKKNKMAAPENTKLVEKLRRESRELYNIIKAVDYNLFGKGSPEFNNMVRDLRALKTYAESELEVDDKGTISAEVLAEYYDMQKECIDSVAKYVEHKQEDLQQPGRKESWWRSRHEQPRINASLNALEKLKTSYAYGRNAIITNAREINRPKLDALIKEHDLIKSAEGDNYNKYMNSVAKTAEMIANTAPKLWSPLDGEQPETLKQFLKRTEDYGRPEKYIFASENVYYTDTIAYNAWTKAEKILTGEKHEGKQYKDKEILSSKKLAAVVKETSPTVKLGKMKDIDPKAEADAAKEEVKALKQSMLSRKQAQIDKTNAEKKANAPKL